MKLYLKERGPESHSFLQTSQGVMELFIAKDGCLLSFPAWSRWMQIEAGTGRYPQGGAVTLTRGTLVLAALLLDLAKERQTAGKPGFRLGPVTLGRLG